MPCCLRKFGNCSALAIEHGIGVRGHPTLGLLDHWMELLCFLRFAKQRLWMRRSLLRSPDLRWPPHAIPGDSQTSSYAKRRILRINQIVLVSLISLISSPLRPSLCARICPDSRMTTWTDYPMRSVTHSLGKGPCATWTGFNCNEAH